MYTWPLNVNEFSWLNRLKICGFFLNPKNRWTQDRYVRQYERLVAKYVGCKYAVYVSSGSTANQLLVQYIKDSLIKKQEWPRKNKVVVSAVTWQTNVSVWIREGFEPIFVDINLKDFCFDYEQLNNVIKERGFEIACVFPTAVLGFTPNVFQLNEAVRGTHIPIMMDCCENILGKYGTKNICNFYTSTTSCFFAHQITNGSEGGFVFTNNKTECTYFLLARAHGLLRNLTPYEIDTYTIRNLLVDSQFDFQLLSSNYRSSDIAAYMGVLDFERAINTTEDRKALFRLMVGSLDRNKYYVPPDSEENVPFSFPIICNRDIDLVKEALRKDGIEFRPFISGNMLRQLPYQKYGHYKDFKNAEYINNNAIYVGYNSTVTEKRMRNLISLLNSI